MLKKIERVLSSRKNQIWLNNLKCNFSQQQTTKNGQKIINRWQDLFIQSIMVIDFQRSIKNNTIDQLLINHLKTSDQFISLKHLLQLYSRAYIRNSKSIKLFTTELNIRLVQGTPDQHLEAFEVVTKRVFNSFSFLMKINLVSKMIKNFKELSRVQKQRFLNMMLGLDYISKQVLQQYKKQCKKKQQIVFKTNNDVDQQFDYLINKLENISFLKDILRKEQFNQLITSKQYEIILNKYLEKLQDVNSLIVILKSNVPHSIFITKLIFQNQIQIHKYKLRIIALYDTIFNQNVTLFRKNPLQMYIPQILSFFNKNDRYILRHTLMKFLSEGLDQPNSNKTHLLKLCQKYNFIFKPLLYQQTIAIKSKSAALMMVKNNNFIKQIYKTCLRRLQKISIIHNLGLKSVFLYDKQSDYLRNKLNSLQNQIQLSTETFLKEYFIKKKNIFFRLKKQIMTELKQQVQEEYLQQMEQNNNEDLDIKNRFMKNKQNEEDEILIEALKAENTIQEFKQPKKSKLKLQNPNYRQNNNLIRSYQYYYKQNHQIQEINYDIETQVKQFIVIIESIGTYFKYYNPFNLKSIKQILSYLTPIIKYFICLPKILENLLMIKFKNPNKQFKIFNVKLDKIVNDAQKEFNNVYANLELISQKQHNFDKSYEKFRIEQLYPQNFKRSPFLYYNKSSKQSQNPQFKIKNFFTERYTLSQQNIINNLYTDILINLYCESSQTKTTVQNLLNKKLVNHQIQKFTKNYLDYPHFADFLVQVKQNQFDAIYILDYSKFYIGSPTMMHQKIKLSQEYFKYLGYNIILININDDQIMRKLKCEYIKR